eukprot:m.184768 g.184768  ORF g.184768 m.184768 type:complete len:823 (-) comp18105_c0_seq3:34-2502(-)
MMSHLLPTLAAFVAYCLLPLAIAGSGLLPYTCAPGTPEATLPFCNRALGFSSRAKDLASRLNVSDHVNFFFSYPGTPYIAQYNVKQWSLDHTCIHGINKLHGVSVFPHAIAQGASFDVDLVKRVSNATAVEARILAAQYYQHTGGQNAGSTLSCDGGPLANSAHDPRWGRISETYGEDPFLIQTIGVTAMRALQNPQSVPGGHADDRFLATRQVTRHYLAYHGGSGDTINGTRYNAVYNVSSWALGDSYIPTYGAYQDPSRGAADGIMCAMTEINGVASCASTYLMTELLRNTWHSDAIIQTDCCDSLTAMVHAGYKNLNASGMLAEAVNHGLGVYFGFNVNEFRRDMAYNLGNGTIKEATIRAAGERVLLSFFRLGFFDQHASDFPFSNASIDWALLDGPAHRALAREAATKSIVLLKNNQGVLPLFMAAEKAAARRSLVGPTVLVVGPFANCTDCLWHSYNGIPSATTTVLQGIQAAAHGTPGATVVHALGANATCGWRCSHSKQESCWSNPSSPAALAIADAAAKARTADVIVLALGLGATVEAEGCDRDSLGLPPVQQQLLVAVLAAKPAQAKTVAIMVSAGGVAFDGTGVDALLYAPYGGEEGGSGLADVLFGTVSPSARLPVTVYSQAWAAAMENNVTTSLLNLDLDVGLGRTYRFLPADNLANTVVWPFGFGLSYTQFRYDSLTTRRHGQGVTASLAVSVSVANTGSRDASEVVQVYLQPPAPKDAPTTATGNAAGARGRQPLLWLAAFDKVTVTKGSSETVSLTVTTDQLMLAQEDGTRKVVPGTYTVWVGGCQPGCPATSTSGTPIKTTVELK